MSSELQILEAFRTWWGVARTVHPEEALPNGEELIAAARDHKELNPGGSYPALLVWATALKKVRALALTANADAIPTMRDLYRPELGAVPSPAPADPPQEVIDGRLVPPATRPAQTFGTGGGEEPLLAEVVPEGEHTPATQEPEPDTDTFSAQQGHAPAPTETAAETTKATETVQATETADQTDTDLRGYPPHEFRMLDGFADVSPLPGAELWRSTTDDGAVELQWQVPQSPGTDGPRVRLFRIISEEEEFDQDPEFGEQRAVTVGRRWVDRDPLTTAYRMYQVWMHEGSSETIALRSEPQLVGETWYIRPIEHIDLSIAGSEVKGQWAPQEHTHRVAVFAAQSTERRTRARNNEIATSAPNLQGFRYTPQYKGVDYKFVAQRYVLIHGGQVASEPSAEFFVTVPAEVAEVPITVETTREGSEMTFSVSWENPNSGEVRIYRTRHAPVDGLSDRVVEVGQLESFGLPLRDWANDLERGLSSCRVDWPDDWYSVFITPVSVVGNQAMVGRSHSRVRVGEVSNPTLHERVSNQLLTFGWPEEAHEVTAVFGEPGTGRVIRPTLAGPGSNLASIHRQAYEQEGGMRLHLPAPGDVALFPSRVYEGEQIWGEPAVLRYDGLREFRYFLFENGGRISLVIYSDREEHIPRQFTLRMQRHRLPLESGDGLEVNTRRISEDGQVEQSFLPGVNTDSLYPDRYSAYWELDLDVAAMPLPSYLRLFARDDHRPGTPVTALVDPPPASLDLSAWRHFLGNRG